MSIFSTRHNVKYQMILSHNEIMPDEDSNQDNNISIETEYINALQSHQRKPLLTNDCYTDGYTSTYKDIAAARACFIAIVIVVSIGFVFWMKYLMEVDFEHQQTIDSFFGNLLYGLSVVCGAFCILPGMICSICISIECCCTNCRILPKQQHHHDQWVRMKLEQRFDYVLSNWT